MTFSDFNFGLNFPHSVNSTEEQPNDRFNLGMSALYLTANFETVVSLLVICINYFSFFFCPGYLYYFWWMLGRVVPVPHSSVFCFPLETWERGDDSDWTVSLSSELSGQQQQPSQMKQMENSAAVARDEELKESVRQVLQAHTDGVALYQFAEVYQVQGSWDEKENMRTVNI